MIIQARFGTAQTGVGYQFYDSTGALLGSRVTADISELPETGAYVADATVPAGTAGVYWDTDEEEASEDLRDALVMDSIGTTVADAVLKRGVANTDTTAELGSLTELILATFESELAGAAWNIRKTDGSDFNTRSVTTNPNADPIVRVT